MVNTFISFLASLIFTINLMPFSTAKAQSASCALPEWFFTIENFNSQNMAIGVSDNSMEKEKAFKEAKLKALINHSLLHDAKYSSLTTSGIGNQQNNSYSATSLEYVVLSAVISGEIISPDYVEVVDSFYTQNKEAIVLIRIDRPDSLKSGYSYTINRRAGFQKENSEHPFFVDELDLLVTNGDSIVYTSEIFKESNTISNRRVKAGMNMFEFLSDIQFFKPYLNYKQPAEQALPAPLNFGLWNSYLFNLVDQICLYTSFNTDFHHKLSSSNLGNLSNNESHKTIQQYVYSLKNIQSREIGTTIENIAITGNQLFCYFKPVGESYDFEQNTVHPLNRDDRKELKNLKEENWKYLGKNSVKNAWFEAKDRISSSPNHLVTGISLKANNLSSGLLEAVQLAKLELSSLLSAKISALSLQNQNNASEYINSAKLLNITKTNKIEPFYLFYRQINRNSYQIKAILFYRLNEI